MQSGGVILSPVLLPFATILKKALFYQLYIVLCNVRFNKEESILVKSQEGELNGR